MHMSGNRGATFLRSARFPDHQPVDEFDNGFGTDKSGWSEFS